VTLSWFKWLRVTYILLTCGQSSSGGPRMKDYKPRCPVITSSDTLVSRQTPCSWLKCVQMLWFLAKQLHCFIPFKLSGDGSGEHFSSTLIITSQCVNVNVQTRHPSFRNDTTELGAAWHLWRRQSWKRWAGHHEHRALSFWCLELCDGSASMEGAPTRQRSSAKIEDNAYAYWQAYCTS